MSGTAGLSAAKNRRSGNEVKFNGQSKSIPPPVQTSISSQQSVVRQQNMMPSPMEILKSHEFRLQQLEGDNMKQEFLNHKLDFLTLKTDLLTLKNELLVNNKKAEVLSGTNASCGTNASTNSAEVTALQNRVSELNTIVANLTKEIGSIKQYIREKVEPTLTKRLLHHAPAHVPAPVPAPAPAPAPVTETTPALLPLEEIHLNIPFIEPELVNIQVLSESKLEPVFDNITLSIEG